MNSSRRRIHEELRMVEKQLPLYYKKVSELERRQQELHSYLEEQDQISPISADDSRISSIKSMNGRPIRKRIRESDDVITQNEASPKAKSLGAVAKTNLVKILGEAREKFDTLGEGLSQAAAYLETMILVLHLMEQSGGELHQHLLKTASSIQQQVKNPSFSNSASNQPSGGETDRNENTENISVEALMDIIKSPYFQQLAEQLKKASDNS